MEYGFWDIATDLELKETIEVCAMSAQIKKVRDGVSSGALFISYNVSWDLATYLCSLANKQLIYVNVCSVLIVCEGYRKWVYG